MSITIAGVTFDNVFYDREADVLYLHVGDPASATDFDESPEGHGLRFDAAGRLVGMTLVDPGALIAGGEPVVVTVEVPERVTIDSAALSPLLSAA